MNDAKKLECFEHFAKTIAGQKIESYTPERGLQQLEQIVMLAQHVLQCPDIMDPVRQKRDHEKAMEAYRNGEYVTLEELRKMNGWPE